MRGNDCEDNTRYTASYRNTNVVLEPDRDGYQARITVNENNNGKPIIMTARGESAITTMDSLLNKVNGGSQDFYRTEIQPAFDDILRQIS